MIISILSCHKSEKIMLFELVSGSGISFNNTVVDQKQENCFVFRNYYNGGGVAIGDLNNDGLPEVMLTSNMGSNQLYLNKGNFKFEDITKTAGIIEDSMWNTGVVFADINNDGYLDIYTSASGHMLPGGKRKNKLYINNKNLSFTESAKTFGLDVVGYTTQASFFDYDLDGDLDCFMINNSPIPANQLGVANNRDLLDSNWNVIDFVKGGGDHLYKNDNGFFKEVTKEAGIHGTLQSFGLGVSVTDVNNDGYLDVYVSNDSYERDYLYINQKNGTFKDEMESWIAQNSLSSMGADAADINNDGYIDIFTTDMLPEDDYRLKTLGAFDHIDLYNQRIKNGLYRQFMKNCLYVNNQNNKFKETAYYSGVAATDWSWGALFLDADNDGFNDIFVCNGVNKDVTNLDFMDFFANDVNQKMVLSGVKQSVDSILQHIPVNPMPNKAFRNMGNLKFEDAGAQWGFMKPTLSNGAAYGDLDGDGDLDLVINNENQSALVYNNKSRQQNGNHYIGFLLKGTDKNSFAIGSKIKIFIGPEIIYREIMPVRGFQSSVDYKQVIGVGAKNKFDSIIIEWPNRTQTKYMNLKADTVHNITQPAHTDSIKMLQQPVKFFDSIPALNFFTQHIEDDYIDFYYERNLPEQLSREGPAFAKGDVNGDGWEDVFIGGGKGQSGKIYINTGNGFKDVKQPAFDNFLMFEDVAALFFDADKDGDLDLYVGAGGNDIQPGSREIQHRLYKNDGKGMFTIDVKAFPVNSMNIAVAACNDYDEDGDQDLFIGSRSVPYQYGISPLNVVYENDGQGHFKDVTVLVGKSLQQLGMITDAAWADVDGDKHNDLIITGAWMPTVVFSYNKNTKEFEQLKQIGLENLNGLWESLAIGDVDGNGTQDILVGNIGENFYLRPDYKQPVKLWLNDFDKNGAAEQFLTRSLGGKDMPVFLKREITDQFPGLKKENLRHSDYAKKAIQNLFNKEVINSSIVKTFNYPSSIIAYNNGKGKFMVKPLPQSSQLSNTKAITLIDVNKDNKLDVITAGNLFNFPPQFGRLDASFGNILLYAGKDSLTQVADNKSGLNLQAETKHLATIKMKDGLYLLAVLNNQYPELYRLN